MLVFADTPSSGLIFGGPLLALTVLALAALAIAFFVAAKRSRSSYTSSDHRLFGFICTGAAVIVALVSLAGYWPYKHDYHFWVPVQGKVENVSKRLVSDGDKGMQERYVVTIDGQPYGIDDTRASLVKKGDTLSIACKKEYQWGSRDHGWGCRWDGGVKR